MAGQDKSYYYAFHKHANSEVHKPPSQLRFSLPSIIITITSNEPWNTETHKTDRNPPIANHKPWHFEPVKVKFCFLRGPLRWLTAAKNAIVRWSLNFTFRVFVKSAVTKDVRSYGKKKQRWLLMVSIWVLSNVVLHRWGQHFCSCAWIFYSALRATLLHILISKNHLDPILFQCRNKTNPTENILFFSMHFFLSFLTFLFKPGGVPFALQSRVFFRKGRKPELRQRCQLLFILSINSNIAF